VVRLTEQANLHDAKAERWPVQRVKCGARIHRIEWSDSGPRLLDDGSESVCRCRERAEEWRALGVSLEDVHEWVSAGFANARVAAPWTRMGAAPSEAGGWKARGFNASDTNRWRELQLLPPMLSSGATLISPTGTSLGSMVILGLARSRSCDRASSRSGARSTGWT
jgi:hypothetical protein